MRMSLTASSRESRSATVESEEMQESTNEQVFEGSEVSSLAGFTAVDELHKHDDHETENLRKFSKDQRGIMLEELKRLASEKDQLYHENNALAAEVEKLKSGMETMKSQAGDVIQSLQYQIQALERTSITNEASMYHHQPDSYDTMDHYGGFPRVMQTPVPTSPSKEDEPAPFSEPRLVPHLRKEIYELKEQQEIERTKFQQERAGWVREKSALLKTLEQERRQNSAIVQKEKEKHRIALERLEHFEKSSSQWQIDRKVMEERRDRMIQVWREEKDGEVENMKERERLLKEQISQLQGQIAEERVLARRAEQQYAILKRSLNTPGKVGRELGLLNEVEELRRRLMVYESSEGGLRGSGAGSAIHSPLGDDMEETSSTLSMSTTPSSVPFSQRFQALLTRES